MSKLAEIDIDLTDSTLSLLLPRLEGARRFVRGGRFKFEPTGHNLEVVGELLPDVSIRLPTPQEPDSAPIGSGQAQPQWPMVHPWLTGQGAAAERARGKRHFALFCQQGTGKTKLTIDKAGEHFLAGEITGVLVVAPKGVHDQWTEQQLPEHWPAAIPHNALSFPYSAKQRKQLARIMDPEHGCSWLAVTVDSIKYNKAKRLCHDFVRAHKGRVLMVIDESHKIKDTRTGRWRSANELGRKCSHRLLLSGTPVAKDLTDEWSQLKWLNERILGQKYISTFRAEYCVMGGYEGKQVIGHRNWKRFRAATDPYVHRLTKEEIGLRPPIHDRWSFHLTNKQKSLFREMRKELVAQIDSGAIISAANAAVKIGMLQQITNGFLLEQGEFHSIVEPEENPRLLALLDKLDELGDNKVAIWAKYVKDIELIKDMLGSPAVTYYGKTSTQDRKRAIEEFNNADSAVRYFVSNPSSGGTGLNLQFACARAIYYSNSDNSVDRWQSEDRIHRIGQERNVIYTDLIAEGGLDTKIIRNLKRKETIANMAVGDIRQWLLSEE